MEDALGYIRVSSEEQADSGLGLEAQRQRIAAYCAMKGLRLAEVFADPGISGGKPLASHPAGSRLLSAAFCSCWISRAAAMRAFTSACRAAWACCVARRVRTRPHLRTVSAHTVTDVPRRQRTVSYPAASYAVLIQAIISASTSLASISFTL